MLDGAPGPLRDFALINAAPRSSRGAARRISRAGVELAAESIDSGAAAAKLDAFVAAHEA